MHRGHPKAERSLCHRESSRHRSSAIILRPFSSRTMHDSSARKALNTHNDGVLSPCKARREVALSERLDLSLGSAIIRMSHHCM